MRTKSITFLLLLLLSFVYQGFSQSYNRFYEQGMKEFGKNNFYAAAQCFKQSHDMIPDVTAITEKLAESLLYAHSYEQSLSYFDEVITKSPGKFPMAYFYQAELQKTLKQYSDAMSSYKFYFHNFGVYDEYHKKAEQQIPSCDFAIKNTKQANTSITKLKAPFNTIFSEISLAEYGDSVILYSALTPNEDSSYFTAKMFLNKHIFTFEKLVRRISEIKTNVIDLSISPDQKTAYFCACVDTNKSHDFKIYRCVFDSLSWSVPELLPEPINLAGFRSTQPFATRINGNDYLFYVSDRPGGQGNLDIWYSQLLNGHFLKPENAGNTINTIGDDVTPFYDSVSTTLYFSSEMHKGYGGFDIFSSKGVPNNWSEPVNVGLPINSSFNETYFTISQNRKRNYFTSDRETMKIDENDYHFNDFYCFNNPIDSTKNIHLKDSITYRTPVTIVSAGKNIKSKEINNTTGLKSEKPIVYPLYFDHDIPEMGANKSFTYRQLLNQYIESPESKIKELQELHLENAYVVFSQALTAILEKLKNGILVEISLKAYTSPTGSRKYNTQLAERRIESIKQFLQSFNGGILKPYIDKNLRLKILTPEIPVSNGSASNEALQMASQRKVELGIYIQK